MALQAIEEFVKAFLSGLLSGNLLILSTHNEVSGSNSCIRLDRLASCERYAQIFAVAALVYDLCCSKNCQDFFSQNYCALFNSWNVFDFARRLL
jgi:hypothetical protein